MFDEAALPRTPDSLRESCWNEHQIYLVFKSDFLTFDDMRHLKPVNLSLIDFEIALSAETFVGTSRSTFSNLAALQRNFMGKTLNHFVYNKRGPHLVKRTDCGRHADAVAATQ